MLQTNIEVRNNSKELHLLIEIVLFIFCKNKYSLSFLSSQKGTKQITKQGYENVN